MKEEEFTIAIYSENVTGILSRVVGIFTRRHISINTLTVSESSIKGIHRMTVVIKVTEDLVQKVVAQCDKQVDILKAFYYDASEIVHQEIALYKVPTSAFTGGNSLEKLIRSHNARILEIEKEFVVIEKTGHESETQALLKDLEKIGIYEFVRSGRIAIVRQMEMLNTYLRSLETS